MLSLEDTLMHINEIKFNIKDKKLSDNNLVTNIKYLFKNKFKEVEEVFKQIDIEGMISILKNSEINSYKENDCVFEKGQDCTDYYFLLFGDISIYSDKNSDAKAKLLKTISGGVIFGHKVKDKLQYFAYSKSSKALILSINKLTFNNIIDSFKTRSNTNKINFLKKYIPNIRNTGEDIINSIKDKFMKLAFKKGAKINIDGEFDDFLYIIISGECKSLKSIKKIKQLSNYINDNNITDKTHIVLDNHKRGDIIGLFSAIKGEKANVTIEIHSDDAEIYKISKSDFYYHYGPDTYRLGDYLKEANYRVIECLKSVCQTQQINLNLKINMLNQFVSQKDNARLNNVLYCNLINPISSIPEITIENQGLDILKDASKSIDNSNNLKKLEDIKSKLKINNNTLKSSNNNISSNTNKSQILSNFKNLENNNESKDISKNLALGTQRLAPKSINKIGLSEAQINSKSKLDMISGIRKNKANEDEVNNAFLRINEKKKAGEKTINKLIKGISDSSNINLNFNQLSDKLNTIAKKEIPSNKVNINNLNSIEKNTNIIDSTNNIKDNIKPDKKETYNIDELSDLDEKHLFIKLENLKLENNSKNNSKKGLI